MDRLELAPAGPGKRGQRLRMTAAKHPVRLKWFACEEPGDAVEKDTHSFNRLVAFYFAKRLDHVFVPESWPEKRSESNLKKESMSVRKRAERVMRNSRRGDTENIESAEWENQAITQLAKDLDYDF